MSHSEKHSEMMVRCYRDINAWGFGALLVLLIGG